MREGTMRMLMGVALALLLGGNCVAAKKNGEAGKQATGGFRFEAEACVNDYANAGVRCGRVSVPEDWAQPGGRRIRLNVMVIPTTQPGSAPMFVLVGGPGSAATEMVPFFLGDGASYREQQDIVLFDLRGTGESSPLHCPGAEPPRRDLATAYGNPYDIAEVTKCRDELAKRVSLPTYNTASAAKDLEAVRVALRYRQINLHGLSYGTNYALAYMHAYPDQVRAAVLESVVAPSDLHSTRFAVAAQRGLDALLDNCAAHLECRSKYPDPRGDLQKVLADLAAKGGFTANAGEPAKPVRFTVSGEQFMEELRGVMSVSPLARVLPKLLHDAAGGDYQTFVDLTVAGKMRPNSYARGLYFSMICTDSYSHLDYAKEQADDTRTAFGDYKLRIQRDVCNVWPKTTLPASYYEEFSSSIPTLFISGELDPVTSPDWAARTAKRFSHGRHVFVPGMGHVPAADAEVKCLGDVEEAFLAMPDAGKVDASCLEDMPMLPFS
jgi:pimeloyl-ACP methyl ester carboxylesterase